MAELPRIATKDLIKVYKTGRNEVIALRGLDVTIDDAQMVAIMGPSGCGKTTLMNLIGGIDRPTAGSINVDGVNIVNYSDAELVRYRRERVGFVFQFFNLVPTLTAEENVELPMRLRGLAGGERRRTTTELMSMVGLTPRATHKPDELSGGEQQRVSIAVALANNPPLVLADEPTGELDTKTGQEVLDLFTRLHRDLRKTVIIVTHDQRVARIADRILHIEDGRIVEEERPVPPGARGTPTSAG